MGKRLIVTGAGGFVAGSVIIQGASDGWDVHALTRGDALTERDGIAWHQIDISDRGRLGDVVHAIRPDAIIHAAAMADIDYCEAHREEAEDVNVGVTETLARVSDDLGAKLVFLSTDTVFDGTRGMYRETDPPGPVNFYAETKVRAEQVVMMQPAQAVVARLSLIVGLPVLGVGNSLLAKVVPALQAGREVGAPDDEIRTPIDVITLAKALLELAASDVAGYIHLAGNDRLTRFAMLRRIAERMGYSSDPVVARSARGKPGRAPRPADVSLCNEKARTVLATPMRGLDEGIDLILDAQKGIFP